MIFQWKFIFFSLAVFDPGRLKNDTNIFEAQPTSEPAAATEMCLDLLKTEKFNWGRDKIFITTNEEHKSIKLVTNSHLCLKMKRLMLLTLLLAITMHVSISIVFELTSWKDILFITFFTVMFITLIIIVRRDISVVLPDNLPSGEAKSCWTEHQLYCALWSLLSSQLFVNAVSIHIKNNSPSRKTSNELVGSFRPYSPSQYSSPRFHSWLLRHSSSHDIQSICSCSTCSNHCCSSCIPSVPLFLQSIFFSFQPLMLLYFSRILSQFLVRAMKIINANNFPQCHHVQYARPLQYSRRLP